MSEAEIKNILDNLEFDEYEWWLLNYPEQDKEQDLEMVENAIQGLLDLYNKEKEKNKELLEGLKYRVKYCRLLERELYGNENIELTKIEQELLEERN